MVSNLLLQIKDITIGKEDVVEVKCVAKRRVRSDATRLSGSMMCIFSPQRRCDDSKRGQMARDMVASIIRDAAAIILDCWWDRTAVSAVQVGGLLARHARTTEQVEL